jgi:putative methylase
MTSLRRLAALLSRVVPPIPNPMVDFEQYPTPTEIAVRLATAALEAGGEGPSAYADLGSGTCRLTAALALLGASRVVAVEYDQRLCPLCRGALESLGLGNRVAVTCSFLNSTSGPLRPGAFDVIVSNPPFGVHRRGADREFLIYALRLKPRAAFFILKSGNLRFHERLASSMGYHTRLLWTDYIPLSASMPHHRSRIRRVRVDIVEFRRQE